MFVKKMFSLKFFIGRWTSKFGIFKIHIKWQLLLSIICKFPHFLVFYSLSSSESQTCSCKTSATMAKSGQLVAVLSLCLLAVVVNAQGECPITVHSIMISLFPMDLKLVNLLSLSDIIDNTPPPPPGIGNQICTFYTQGGTLLLDGPKVFEMMLIEFGRAIQVCIHLIKSIRKISKYYYMMFI